MRANTSIYQGLTASRKKTVAFSTHNNPNTKENIANVYGAKTLLALIPLDLKFEMDASNRPGSTQSTRNWSIQEDAGSREVRIIGHISRPVVGEGRQTPDRQMFFVNSRPCSLPQVAKAFNEVYKSYNITQSPFIFADIKLDTNAYDVNVSPDKRTILLHDQTVMLESLKNALVELFEGHDQSVPQAQLLDRKLPSFKPTTIRPRMSIGSSMEEGTLSTKANSVPDAQPQAKPSTSPKPPEEAPQPGFIKASLIERFAGRTTKERIYQPTRQRNSASPEKEDDSILIDQLEGSEAKRSKLVAHNEVEHEDSPLFEPEVELKSAKQLPKAVQDFNARIASQHAKQMAREQSPRPPRLDEVGEEEECIPAIKQTPQKRSSQSTIQNAFDRMRPMRTPAQQATITIGDTTTVSTIGSESRASKRARIYTPKFSLDGTPLSQTPKKPLFMKSLRGFAAPGTQTEASDEENGEDEAEVNPDSSVPDMPVARSSSPVTRVIPGRIIRRSADERTQVSSTRSLPPAYPNEAVDEEEREERPEPQPDIEGSDEEYFDDTEKKAREEAKIAKMIAEAEKAASRPSGKTLNRANKLLTTSQKKYNTIHLVRFIETSADIISRQSRNLELLSQESQAEVAHHLAPTSNQLDTSNPEERLSLTVTKADFHHMRIIGQFNLGFILAVRPPTSTSPNADLFIIDQHASDEKYNFEKLSATTMLVSQKLVRPHPLELTAVEEEVILNNEHALNANGFAISIDTSGDAPVGQRAKLTSLPMSKEVTFTPIDLEELLSLLLDNPFSSAGSQFIPRPSKVRKVLASRACRSSIMIGKTLRNSQMEKVVKHMGEMDKPWSCPHGRPTMRHLFGLEKWEGWKEGDGVAGFGEVKEKTDWASYLGVKKANA